MDSHTLSALVEENQRLNARVREFEERYAPVFVVESILKTLYAEYIKQTNAAPRSRLSCKFFVRNQAGMTPLPDEVEYMIESLWLGRIDACPISFNGVLETLRLHPSQLKDDLPLPLIMCRDGTNVPIVKRSEERAHIFLTKHDPAFKGIIIENAAAKKWATNATIATSSEVSHFPLHLLLSQMIDLWMGRESSLKPRATLVVNASLVRNFVTTLARNEKAQCHFTCTGQKELFAYLCITSGDGMHTDLQRLFIGNVSE
jgi:hypothetical protein